MDFDESMSEFHEIATKSFVFSKHVSFLNIFFQKNLFRHYFSLVQRSDAVSFLGGAGPGRGSRGGLHRGLVRAGRR